MRQKMQPKYIFQENCYVFFLENKDGETFNIAIQYSKIIFMFYDLRHNLFSSNIFSIIFLSTNNSLNP